MGACLSATRYIYFVSQNDAGSWHQLLNQGFISYCMVIGKVYLLTQLCLIVIDLQVFKSHN